MTNDDMPEPDVPPEDVDPELERLLAWFIKRNRRIAWTYGYEQIFVVPHDTGQYPKSKEVRFITLFSKQPPQEATQVG